MKTIIITATGIVIAIYILASNGISTAGNKQVNDYRKAQAAAIEELNK